MLRIKSCCFCYISSFGKIMILRQKHWTEIRAELLSHLKGEVQMHGGSGRIDMGRRKWDAPKFWAHVGGLKVDCRSKKAFVWPYIQMMLWKHQVDLPLQYWLYTPPNRWQWIGYVQITGQLPLQQLPVAGVGTRRLCCGKPRLIGTCGRFCIKKCVATCRSWLE